MQDEVSTLLISRACIPMCHSLSPGQLALLTAVAGNASKPIIVLTLTATPLDLTPALINPMVGAQQLLKPPFLE